MPDRAVGPAHHRTAQHHRRPDRHRHRPGTGTVVVVEAGDCLWHLAAADLPRDAGPAEIAARWQAIYRLNRAVIGADPDLIHPGQRLVLPAHDHR